MISYSSPGKRRTRPTYFHQAKSAWVTSNDFQRPTEDAALDLIDSSLAAATTYVTGVTESSSHQSERLDKLKSKSWFPKEGEDNYISVNERLRRNSELANNLREEKRQRAKEARERKLERQQELAEQRKIDDKKHQANMLAEATNSMIRRIDIITSEFSHLNMFTEGHQAYYVMRIRREWQRVEKLFDVDLPHIEGKSPNYGEYWIIRDYIYRLDEQFKDTA